MDIDVDVSLKCVFIFGSCRKLVDFFLPSSSPRHGQAAHVLVMGSWVAVQINIGHAYFWVKTARSRHQKISNTVRNAS